LLWFSFFVVFSVFVFFLQNFLPYSDFYEGLFIPDTINMSNTFDNLKESGDSLLSTGLVGIYFIYYLSWITHPAFSILINYIFVYYSFKLIYEIFVKNNLAGQIVCLGLFINPYVFFAITGPNKEIPLIWATLYIVRNLLYRPGKWFLKSLVLSILVATVRDGYGVILLLATVIFSLNISVKLMCRIAILFAFLASFLADLLMSNLSVLEKNLVISQSINSDAQSSALIGDLLANSTNPLLSVIKEFLRMVYNWLTLSVFPVFITDSGFVYSLGLAYWIYGVSISICLLAALYGLFSNKIETIQDKNKLKIAGFIVFVWATVSISLFIQPRYLMPILPISFGVLMTLRKKTRYICIFSMLLFSLSIMLLYSLSGVKSPIISFDDNVEGSVK
ncbi:hypothetical protein DBR27_19400, partial [Flavobacterium sp. HMWF030]